VESKQGGRPIRNREAMARRQADSAAAISRHEPDFLIIGAAKCGTTSLYNYLIEHPDVAGAAAKELRFFDVKFRKGWDWYLAQFPERGAAQIVGESSPTYLFDPSVPGRVKTALPNAKLIVMLRNPVDRAYSQYTFRTRRLETASFRDEMLADIARWQATGMAVEKVEGSPSYIARGIYADQLDRWFAHFPQDQFHIIRSEDLFADPVPVFAAVLEFLALPSWRPEQFRAFNAGAYTGMEPDMRQLLTQIYAPHNRRLESMLDRRFGWDEDEP
jgi:hypothetical protein